jgi:acetyl esterase/lipase
VREPRGGGRQDVAMILVGVVALVVATALLVRPAVSPGDLTGPVAGGLALAAASQFLAARRLRSLRVLAGLVWGAAALGAPDVGRTDHARPGAGRRRHADRGRGTRRPPGRPAAPRSNVRFAASAAAATHLCFGLGILVLPSASAFTLGIVVGVWMLLFAARTVVHGLDLRRAGSSDVATTGRWSPRVRMVGSLAMLLVGVLVGGVAHQVGLDTTPDPGPFYATPPDLDPTPGTILRTEVITPFVDGGTAHRVLYTSRGLRGEPVALSGIVIVPEGTEVPVGGRPILAHTHGTIGVDRSCAPSLLGSGYASQVWGLEAFLDAGWIVAAPDYLGLGSEGDHPYLDGTIAAVGTLDIVRAARELAGDEAGDRFAVAGHSQGGHAALFAGQRADTYAPELELLGVAALAPASELAALIETNDGTTFGNLLGAYAVAAWDRAFDDVDAASIVDAAVLPLVERLASTCVATGPEALALVAEAELLQLAFLVSPIWDTEPWASRIAENTPGGEPTDAPILIVQGADDVLIRPDIQRRFAARLCEARQLLEYRELTGAGHLDVDDEAADDVVAWLGDRLAGDPAVTTCDAD